MYYPTSIPDLVANVTVKECGEGRIRALATGINPEDDMEYLDLGRVSSKPYSRKRQEIAVNEVRTKLETIYKDFYGNIPASAEDMKAAFDQVKDAVMHDHMHLHPRWTHDSTNKGAIVFFERNTLSYLLPFADPSKRMFLPSDREAIEQALIEISKNRNGHDHARAVESVQKRLREADIIYSHLQDRDNRLPKLRLSSDAPFTPVHKTEQIKYLPRGILMKFYLQLFDLVKKYPRFVFFCVFVVFGLRPAEAAARKPSDIHWEATYCTAEVSSQERGGFLDPQLKNKYSRRVIIISFWGMQLLKCCCEQIGKDYPHDERSMNIAVDCSLRVKRLLLECGCDETFLNGLESSVAGDDLDTDDEKEQSTEKRRAKLGCYILRRVFATIARSIMGLSLYETDRLLGHIPTGANGKRATNLDHVDLNAADTQKAIADKMERYIFDPRFSLNPSCSPYHLSGKDVLPIIEFSEYIISNDTEADKRLSLNLEAAEAGERTTIVMSHGTTQCLNSISTPKKWEGRSRMVIGDTSQKGIKQNE